MPLQDHFRPPLSVRRHWHSFHNAWATYLAAALNRHLPEGYFAEPNVQFGIEIDVAAYEAARGNGPPPAGGWSPPAPALSAPVVLLSDLVEVQVFGNEGGPTLARAVEIVSPANKDRPANRDAFVSKCAAYVQQGVGLAVVDVVTERAANLHTELLTRLGVPRPESHDSLLYATSYRPAEREGRTMLDVWHESLTVGGPLPTVPLWLRGGICYPLELEATYLRTCEEQRVPLNGATV
jgi:hypothetical protein